MTGDGNPDTGNISISISEGDESASVLATSTDVEPLWFHYSVIDSGTFPGDVTTEFN